MAQSGNQLDAGQIRRLIRLGSEALYRVCACEGKHVWVEVVDAPGLKAGQHFKLLRSDVAKMQLVADSSDVPAAAPQPALPELPAV